MTTTPRTRPRRPPRRPRRPRRHRPPRRRPRRHRHRPPTPRKPPKPRRRRRDATRVSAQMLPARARAGQHQADERRVWGPRGGEGTPAVDEGGGGPGGKDETREGGGGGARAGRGRVRGEEQDTVFAGKK